MRAPSVRTRGWQMFGSVLACRSSFSRGASARSAWRARALLCAASSVLLLGASAPSAQALCTAAAPLPSGDVIVTCPYSGSEDSIVIPAGFSAAQIVATSGHAGVASLATASATIAIGSGAPLSAGQTLYVAVGGNGDFFGGASFNGGGAGGGGALPGLGGGGASDVRTCPRVTCALTADLTDPRLVVAGAPGGHSASGDAGGAPGIPSPAGNGDSGPGAGGGTGATTSAPGSANAVGSPGTNGTAGSGGSGGPGLAGGGGGGGGWFGGGGGSGGHIGGGGGGGGSSFAIAEATDVSYSAANLSDPTQVTITFLAAAASPYADAVLADTPAGYWRFGEESGLTALDSSGNGNHGTYTNGPVLGVPGALAGDLDTAVSMDGINDTVRVPDANTLDVGNTFTAEGWIKRTATTKVHELMNKSFQLTVMGAANGNQVFLRKPGVSTIARTTGGIGTGAYHHIAVTKNGSGAGSVKFYIDGVLAPSVEVSAAQVIVDNNTLLTFGAAGSTSADYDEFAIYDSVLTADQVADHYAAGAGAG